MPKRNKVQIIGKKRGSLRKKSKIIIDARGIRKTTGRYIHMVLKYLQNIDQINEYHVLINEEDQGMWKPDVDNFHLHIVPYKHYSLGEQLGFARYLYKMKPDLVHFYMPQQPLLYFGKRVTSVLDLTLIHFKNLDKNKLIYSIEQAIFKFLLKNVSKRSKQVITISNYVKDELAEFAKIKKSKITTTYLSAENLEKGSPKSIKPLQGKKFILYVGNAFPHKNLEILTDAFNDFQKKNKQHRLVIIGKKDFFHDQLEKQVHTRGYDNIDFLGFVPDDQLAWAYKNAEMYAFPSLSEGFGLPPLEAMAYQLPVISSNASCLPEVLGDSALYFDPHSKEDIAGALEKLSKNKKLREKLIKAGSKQLEKYSWEETAEQTHEVYLKAMR